MADGMAISTNAAELMQRFDRLPACVQNGLLKGIKRGLLLAEDRVRTNTGCNRRKGAAGVFGRLTSFAGTTPAMGVDGQIGFRKTKGFPYELAQEFGAHAKPGGAMTMPLTAKARAAGGARNFPGKLIRLGRILVEAVALKTRTNLVPQYVLLKSIPPRLKFRENVIASIPMISDEIEAGGKEGLSRV